MALWDGRFSGGPAEDMIRFSESLSVDLRMWREDIAGSVAHAQMLGDVGLLTAEEVKQLVDGLHQVGEEIAHGIYVPGPEHEDIHMAVEARLTALVGEVGAKLHTARSRNDQVATDVRLWLKSRLGDLRQALLELLSGLLDRVERDGDVLFPGFTHLQRGQPIWFGHHLLAYAWMVRRDADRVQNALERMDECPLGAGAMAGTPHPIDRHRTAALLGFARPVENAMDAVASRDHAIEAVSACAIAMSHFSRMSEELVLWSTEEFAFIRMGDGYATGSSIMPQKRNPDAAELVRGKAGRVFGSLQALLTMVKGLPLAYNRDLQEDRASLFDAVETTTACARILSGVWRTLTVNGERYEQALQGHFLLATELADFLVTRGVPFRESHHIAGKIVAFCEERKTDFAGITVSDLQSFHPAFDEQVHAWLDPKAAAERRRSFGGTSQHEIQRQLALLRAVS